MRRFFIPFLLIFVGFIAGLVLTGRMRLTTESNAAAAPSLDLAPAEQRPAPPVGSTTPSAPPVVSPPMTTDFTRVAATAVKGVANISSVQVVRRSNSPFGNDPFFEYFFGGQDAFGSRDRRSLSLGSGVIVSDQGYVVTNNHVVGDNVREVTVALPDKRDVPARIIGTDPATDIALLKIEAKNLAALTWGNSDRLQVGEWVLAIGSPFQLSQTVTAGIVSATGRANVGFAEYEDFIQTDAAINPGNSGGALVNIRGELVGINTGIFSQSGGYQGIGFAVPAKLASHVVDELMRYGEVRRGTIGGILSIDRLTPQYAAELGVSGESGAVVMRMTRDSAAYAAGIRPGDVIVRFNATAVNDPSQLYRLVADAPIGSTATLRVLRNGRSVEFKVPIVSDSRSAARR